MHSINIFKRRWRIALRITGLLIYASAICGQEYTNSEIHEQLVVNTEEQYFCFRLDEKVDIDKLSRVISIDKVDSDGTVYAYANAKEFSRFIDFSIPYVVLPHPGRYDGILNIKDHVDIREIQEWDFYPTFDAYVDMMYQYAEQYPALCQVFPIGNSHLGRPLLVAKISDNVGTKEEEPQFLYTSSMHGDETTGYILMLRLIHHLLTKYGIDPRITALVNGIEIWINPLANPDGTYYAGNHTVNNARRYNALGVDLNRNYPDPAAGPHPDGNPWQTETLAFMQMAEDNNFVSSANLHGGAEVCNYPWDTWSRLAADDAWWQYVCREYADTAQYYSPSSYMNGFDNGITNGYAWYSITGGRQDYMNYFQQCREFTLEISNTKLLPPQQLPAFWNYNYRSFLNYMEQSTFGLRGTIKDSISNLPIRAEVYAAFHEKDSSWVYSALPIGNYHRLLPAGNYSIRYSAPGYQTKIFHNITIVNRQATYLDVLLVPDGGGVGGVDNYWISMGIQIFPNPLMGSILKYESEYDMDLIRLYDVSGKEIQSWGISASSGTLDLGSMAEGFYYLKFITNKGIGIKKLVINR